MNIPVVATRSVKKNSNNQTVIAWGDAVKDSEIKLILIEKVIKGLLAHLPNLATVIVVEVATGSSLAHLSRTPGFDAIAVAAHNAALVRQKQMAMAALNMRGERLTDILIPFRRQLHLIRLVRDGQWFGYLAIGPQDASLALAREILQSIIP